MSKTGRRPEPRSRGSEDAPVLCGECGSESEYVRGDSIYRRRPDLAHLWFWRCQKCGAYCGCHPGGNRPLGTPAGPKTREARSAAHRVFDPLWRSLRSKSGRSTGYAWLAFKLGLEREACHIGMMSAETAWAAHRACLASALPFKREIELWRQESGLEKP